jgi:hypothetical protein
MQEEFSRSPQKSTWRASLQLHIPQTTIWRIATGHVNPDNNLESPYNLLQLLWHPL